MNKIFFPTLHHELVGDKILKEVTLVNPGLFEEDEQRSCNYFRPRKFPLKTKEAQKYIKDFLMYGDFFENPREIKQSFLLQLIGKDSEKPSSIKSSIKKGMGHTEKIDYFLIAQLTLLLQWTLEEKVLELQKLDRELARDLQQLKHSLGEDVSLDYLQSKTQTTDPRSQINTLLPYDKILPCFFLIIEKNHILITDVQDLYEMWIDFGIEFSIVDDDRELFQTTDFGYRFIFKKKPHEEFNWLNKKFKVEFIRS
ncbi:hypothetical protein JCM13304A_03960 [Desulfothermus okinawensis JCM 13304]